MSSTCRTYNPLRPLSICLLALAALAALVAPSGAVAAVDGGATLKLAPGDAGLRTDGIVVRGTGEAVQRGARLQLPAAGLKLAGRTATVPLRGGILLRAGKRKVLLRRLQIRTQGRNVALKARLGARNLALLRNGAKSRNGVGTNEVKLSGLELVLTGAAAKLLGQRLGVVFRAGDKAARLRLDARREVSGGTTGPGAGKTPVAGPISNEPPVLARPASAVDVSGVEVTWFPRDSWIDYISTPVGPGEGVSVGNGVTAIESAASPCPDRPSGTSDPLPYGFRFTPAASWYDSASGTAGIYGTGDVTFRWTSHGIDLTASNPEVEIVGGASRAVFRVNGSGATPYPNQRADLVALDTTGGPTQVSDDGKTFSYEFVRGTLTQNGLAVFGGAYWAPDNDEFGCVSVKFTTP